MGKMLVVVIDSHSKWPEIMEMNTTTAAKTITVLREIFACYGLPEQVVTDNRPQFTATEFKQFLTANGAKHILCSPYHPSSNGAAERLVQTVKQTLKAGCQKGVLFEQALASFLLQYRTTLHATTGVSPSSLFLNRSLSIRLDLLKPQIAARVRSKQADQKAYHDSHSRARKFSIGQPVMHGREGPQWILGVVAKKLGPLSYSIRVQGGQQWKRHLDHIREGPSLPNSNPVMETNGPGHDDILSPLPSSRPEVTTTQPTGETEQSALSADTSVAVR